MLSMRSLEHLNKFSSDWLVNRDDDDLVVRQSSNDSMTCSESFDERPEVGSSNK